MDKNKIETHNKIVRELAWVVCASAAISWTIIKIFL